MEGITEKQSYRYNIYLQKNNPENVKQLVMQRFGKPFEELTKTQATRALSLLYDRFNPKRLNGYSDYSQSEHYFK